MRSIRLLPVLAVCALVAADASSQPAASVDLKVVKYDGLAEAITKNRGKVVLVDFWGEF